MVVKNEEELERVLRMCSQDYRDFIEKEIPEPELVVPWTDEQRSPGKKRVLVLYTGGTLGMKPEIAEGGDKEVLVPKLSLDELLGIADDATGILEDTDVLGYKISHIDSTEINVKVWQNICNVIEEHYAEIDGAVVLHGTDTMAYTSSALAFMMRNLSIPIVCTGAQLITQKAGSDVIPNLTGAIEVATSDLAESSLYFDGNIFRGTRVEKDDDSRLYGFKNPTGNPIGYLGAHGVQLEAGCTLRGRFTPKDLQVQKELATSVVEIVNTPLTSVDVFGAAVKSPDCRALIIRSYGPGNMPSWYTHLVEFLTQKEGFPVYISSQCAGSGISAGGSDYAVGDAIVRAGAVPLGDMSPAAAVTKLMTVMANHSDLPSIRREMVEKSYAKEITLERI